MLNKTFTCPVCNGKAKLVSYITVKHLVNTNLQETIVKKPYYICMNEICDTVYFSVINENIFFKKDLNVPIWFKINADPKYICYCSKVTEEMIVKAINEKGATNIQEICEITGAMQNCNCIKANPLGKCCCTHIKNILENTLK